MSGQAPTQHTSVLSEKDVNYTITTTTVGNETTEVKNVKSMEFHRQVLQSKMKDAEPKTYVSPSDELMSPCTAKLTALRSKQVGKMKPKSLFAQASAKKLGAGGGGLFGSKTIPTAPKDNES